MIVHTPDQRFLTAALVQLRVEHAVVDWHLQYQQACNTDVCSSTDGIMHLDTPTTQGVVCALDRACEASGTRIGKHQARHTPGLCCLQSACTGGGSISTLDYILVWYVTDRPTRLRSNAIDFNYSAKRRTACRSDAGPGSPDPSGSPYWQQNSGLGWDCTGGATRQLHIKLIRLSVMHTL
jgi:hypothetical protein